MSVSDPLRTQIRSEVAKAVENTDKAQDVIGPMCLFYRQHQSPDPSHDLSHYVSLALYLGEPPAFALKAREAELPPDAEVVVGILPLMQAFYEKIGLHAIWEKHRARRAPLDVSSPSIWMRWARRDRPTRATMRKITMS